MGFGNEVCVGVRYGDALRAVTKRNGILLMKCTRAMFMAVLHADNVRV